MSQPVLTSKLATSDRAAEYLEAKKLQSQGKCVEMRKTMDDATNAHVRGGQ